MTHNRISGRGWVKAVIITAFVVLGLVAGSGEALGATFWRDWGVNVPVGSLVIAGTVARAEDIGAYGVHLARGVGVDDIGDVSYVIINGAIYPLESSQAHKADTGKLTLRLRRGLVGPVEVGTVVIGVLDY